MWVSPLPDELLDKYGLIQKKCKAVSKVYKDVLIYQSDYKLTELDNIFIGEVLKAKTEYV